MTIFPIVAADAAAMVALGRVLPVLIEALPDAMQTVPRNADMHDAVGAAGPAPGTALT